MTAEKAAIVKKKKEAIASSVTDEKTVEKTRKELKFFYDAHRIAIFGPKDPDPKKLAAALQPRVDLGWDESAWMFESDNFVMYGQIEIEEAEKAKSLWYFTVDQVQWGGHASETVVEDKHRGLDLFHGIRKSELKGVPLKCAKRVVRED